MKKKQKRTALLQRACFIKVFRIMKLTAAFLLVCCLSVSAGGHSQTKVTLNFHDVEIQNVINAIESKTHYRFLYSKQVIKSIDKITINVIDQEVSSVVNELLQGTGINYELVDEYLFIFKKADSKITSIPIKGQITGVDNKPLEGASVLIKGSSAGTTTDANGNFSLTAPDDAILIISYVGYEPVEIAAKDRGIINLQLNPVFNSSDKVIVIGYGSMKKKDLSSAVSDVPDMKQIKERPVTDVASMIQGKVPGVTVVNNGGHPDQTPNITIRGKGSRASENVLVVVDGVPNAPYNPADIESIVVLKDAASAAIYGAFSGAAGVILITTRQASMGKPSVEYNSFMGLKKVWKLHQSLTADKQAEVANLANTNAGMPTLEGWDKTKNPDAQVTRTDWLDAVFRTGLTNRHTITINGGTEKFSTLVQGRYEENQGTLLNTFNRNMSARFNTHYQLNPYIRVKQELFYNINRSRGADTNPVGYSGTIKSALSMPRSATVYADDGSFGGTGPRNNPYVGMFGNIANPVAGLLRNNAAITRGNLQSVSELKIANVVKGLVFTTRFSYLNSNTFLKDFYQRSTEPGNVSASNTLIYGTDKSYNWLWENTLNYNYTLKSHNIGAMVSTVAQEYGATGFGATALNLENEEPWARFFINAQNFPNKPTDFEVKDRNHSYVGRLSYSWADRYFLTGSYRYDIAGRLAMGYRGKGFPAATAAWKISSEPFFNIKSIDLLKLRASWGRIGNLGSIPLYYGYAPLGSGEVAQIGSAGSLTRYLSTANSVNPELSWETSEQFDLGLDINALKEKLTFTFDYFNKLTYDLIQEQTTGWPGTFGIGAPFLNQGKIRNTGFEFAVSWRDNAGQLGYEVSANLATLKNRVEYIDGNKSSFWQHNDHWKYVMYPYRSIVGQPSYSYWLVKNAGIFQSDAEANAYVDKNGNKIQPFAKAGDMKFIDQNGDGKIDDQDRLHMGSSFPKLTYGFTANLSWRHFDLSLFLQGVSGAKLYQIYTAVFLNESEPGSNRWDKILDAWSPTNTGSDIPRISSADQNKNFQTPSDWFLKSGDYLRLKSLVIGYTFPRVLKNTDIRVFLSGDNLFTITKYPGLDPEVGGAGLDGLQYPVSRIYALGVKIKF